MRSNQILLAAILGVLSMGAVQPAPTIRSAPTTMSAKKPSPPVRSALEQTCRPGEDIRTSDLCAQWKAADAASDSAWWAWAAGIAGVISAVGVIAALGIALHSNWIARDTAKRQLRAYVGVGACSIATIEDGSGFILQAELVNSGQTPAYDVNLMGESFAESYPMEENRDLKPTTGGHRCPLMPGESLHCAYRIKCDDVSEVIDQVMAGSMGLYIQGVCEYRDAFDAKRETRFRYVFGGRIAHSNGLVLHAAQSGNSAT